MRIFLTIVLLGIYATNRFSQRSKLTANVNDSIRLKLVKEGFIKNNRVIVYWDSTQQAISSIDEKPVYGTDAAMPLTELIFAELQINDKKIKLDTYGMFDPWTETDTNIRCEIEKVLGNPMKLRCLFSYGAGTYFVEWTIIGKESYRTMITYDMKILDLIDFKE